ncbi:MAG: hypothetical protein V4754_04360 [Pseudomonadota bacterium]
MKRLLLVRLLIVISLAALGGCAVVPPAPVYYNQTSPAAYDPYQWHVVSVEPVQSPSRPSRVVYTTEPVYAPAPVYGPQPVYIQPGYMAQPYAQSYYGAPPVSIGLDFVFGFGGRRGWGGRGYYGGHGHHHR